MPEQEAKSLGRMSLTMPTTLHIVNLSRQAPVRNKFNNLSGPQISAVCYTNNMSDVEPNPENKLRAWRTFRRLTQAQLAEAVGTSAEQINHLENRKRGLTHKWLVKLAVALDTSPGFILDHDPHEMSADLFDIWNRGNAEDRQKLLTVAETIIPYRAEPGLK
jgi:transcriptional regulator with XRE-family HTH domain